MEKVVDIYEQNGPSRQSHIYQQDFPHTYPQLFFRFLFGGFPPF